MISQPQNPVEWAGLLTELDEAGDHLQSLIKDMLGAGEIEEADFAVQLGHVYAHLNRAWHSRALTHEIRDDQWSEFSGFPMDLEPVG